MVRDIYADVCLILERARARSPENDRATLELRVSNLGLETVFEDYLRGQFGKSCIDELSGEEVDEAHEHVTLFRSMMIDDNEKVQ